MKKKIFYIFLIVILIFFTEFLGRFLIKLNNEKINNVNLKNKKYGIIVPDNEIGISYKNNAFNSNRVTNNLGFLNFTDISNTNKNIKTFITYGGSTTYCYGIKQAESWPAILQDSLCKETETENCKYRVLNAGAIRYSIGHIYKKFLRDLNVINPDYIIIYSGINEIDNYHSLLNLDKINLDISSNNNHVQISSSLNTWYNQINSLSIKLIYYKIIVPLINKINSLSIIKKNNAKNNSIVSEDEFKVIYDNYKRVLLKIYNTASEKNIKVIFVTQSYGIENNKNILITKFSKKAYNYMKSLGAYVINSDDIFINYKDEKKKLYTESGVHYSKEGAYILGNLIAEILESNILKN